MKAEEIVKRLAIYKETYEIANAKAIKIRKTAKTEFDAIVKEGETYKKELLEELLPVLDEYLNKGNDCGCQRRIPDDVVVQDTGLWIRFWADHPNDICQYTLPYSKLTI